MKNKQVTLYNVIFPVWMLMMFPQLWIVTLPLNFVIDLLVLWLAMRCQKVQDSKTAAKKAILKSWVSGFTADFVGAIGMTAAMMIPFNVDTPRGRWWYDNINMPVAYHPFESIWGFLWTAVCVLIAGLVIYWLNKKWCLKKTDLTEAQKKKVSLAMAVFTAPYLFFLPTAWFF